MRDIEKISQRFLFPNGKNLESKWGGAKKKSNEEL